MRDKIIKRFAAGTCSVCMLYALTYSAVKGLGSGEAETPTSNIGEAAATQTTQYDASETNSAITVETTLSAPDATTSSESVSSQTDTSQTVSSESDSSGSAPPTLSQYLSSLRCSGCRHNCLLVNPRCMRGKSKAQAATTEYYELYGD